MPSRSSKELHVLQEILQVLDRAPSLSRGLDQAVEILEREMRMQRGTVYLRRLGTGEIRIIAAHGLSEEQKRKGRYQVGEGHRRQGRRERRAGRVPRISREPQFLDRTEARKGLPDVPFSACRFWTGITPSAR
jgi:Nif-specific regulatory protein